MKNFLRVVQATLRRRYTFLAAVLCSIGVALLWGGNLAIIRPIIEIVFTDKQPHAWADGKLADARQHLAATQKDLAHIQAALNNAPPDNRGELQLKERSLQQRLLIEENAVKAA